MAVHFTNFVYFLLAIIIIALTLQPREVNCFPHNHNQESEENPSKPLCPGGRLYLNQTHKCYKPQSRGPCPETMRVEYGQYLGPGLGYIFGKCACPIICGRAPMVSWRGNNLCYDVYTQGPCSSGQWLVPKEDAKLACERNPCLEAYKPEPINMDGVVKMFSYGGKCYTNGAVNADLCQPGERATVSDWIYFCHKEEIRSGCGGGGGSPDNVCENGSQADEFGGCEASSNF